LRAGAPGIAEGTLGFLAPHQGRVHDPSRGERIFNH
jgi:hypothetical protein